MIRPKNEQYLDKTPKLLRAEAMKILGLIQRARKPYCQLADEGIAWTPCKGRLVCAHIVPKRASTLTAPRLDNVWTLCDGHHKTVDERPEIWLRLVNVTCGIDHVLDLADAVSLTRTKGLRVVEDNAAATTLCGTVAIAVFEKKPKVSSVMFWRHQIGRLCQIAEDDKVDLTKVTQWARMAPRP